MYAAMLSSQAIDVAPAAVRNPNKAVLTLEYPSTKILIGNDAAHRLFAVGHDQLVGHRLTDMIVHPSTIFQRNSRGPLAENGDTVSEPISSEQSDQLTAACGKVIEIVDALAAVSPAAIWLFPLAQNQMHSVDAGRCLAVLEPVERISASCTLGPKVRSRILLDVGCDEPSCWFQGRIFACDDYVADMFGYQSSTEILGSSITELVPALVLPTSRFSTVSIHLVFRRILNDASAFQDLFRQNLTGRYRNGTSFPVTVKLLPEFEGGKSLAFKFGLGY